jgi:osmotically-inducible protein OsmY
VSRANLLQGFAASKGGETGPSDREIKSKIIATARDEAAVRAPLVDITVKDGGVHLWGNVGSEEERNAVRIISENTEGVREVEDHLRVLPPTRVDRTLE